MSSTRRPPKGRKLLAWEWGLQGDAGAEAWPLLFCSECLRLRLLSRPRLSFAAPTLARLRSLRTLGGNWVSSSPSSCRRVSWIKGGVTENTLLSGAACVFEKSCDSSRPRWDDAADVCFSHLVDVELFYEVEVGAFSAQMSLGHDLDALLLKTVDHVVVRVLFWEACQSLKCNRIKKTTH